MNKKKSLNILPDDMVKDVFSRPQKGDARVSSIFTHRKGVQKIVSSSGNAGAQIPSNIKPIPVAIDIGTKTVKTIRLGVDEEKRFEIIDVDSQTCEVSGIPDSFSAAKNALEALISRGKIGPECISVLPSKDVQVYNMMFPPMSDEELESAVQFKIAQLKPFGLSRDKLICKLKKWDATENIGGSFQERVIIACVSREVLARHIAVLKEAGLSPVSVEAPQFSVVNLSSVYKHSEYGEEVELWVHIGAEESFLSVVKNSVLCFSCAISLVSNQITKSIAKQCRVSQDEAEVLKKEHGFDFWSEDKAFSPLFVNQEPSEKSKNGAEEIYHALMSPLENLVVEIERSFKHFSYQIAHSQITRFNRVILSGGGAAIKKLDEFLNTRLAVPVERFDPFAVFRVSDRVKQQKSELLKQPFSFAIGAALSIGQKAGSSRVLNFLPEEEKSPFRILQASLKQRLVKVIAVSLIAATAVGVSLASTAGMQKARMLEAAEKVKTAKLSLSDHETLQIELAKNENELNNRKKILESQLRLLESAARSSVEISATLSSIASILPEEIWVNSLRYKEGKFVIVGSTVDLVLITELIETIKQTELFSDANFSYTQKEPDKAVYSFEITTTVEEGNVA